MMCVCVCGGGWPGSVHDARVFAISGIFTKLTSEKILDCNYVRIQDKYISLFLIGSLAYPGSSAGSGISAHTMVYFIRCDSVFWNQSHQDMADKGMWQTTLLKFY